MCEIATKSINSPHIQRNLHRIERISAEKFDWANCQERFIALRDAIDIELKQHYYYQYKPDKGKLFYNWKGEWEDVCAAFPDALGDIFSAVDCYALEHNTASVFHSMRVAELGLRALAKDRGVVLPKQKLIEWASWQEILKRIDGEIDVIGKMSSGHEKDRLLAFYSGARADLYSFKDEYRNLVMHVRVSFDEHQAASALNRVKIFMKRLVVFGLSTV